MSTHPRVTCPFCRRTVALTTNGLYWHKADVHAGDNCPGTGTHPVPTPELDKLQLFTDQGQVDLLTDFLEWLTDSWTGFVIAEYPPGAADSAEAWDLPPQLVKTELSITEIMDRYFDLDPNKIEQEMATLRESLGKPSRIDSSTDENFLYD